MSRDDDYLDDELETEEDYDIATNEAKVVVTLMREEEGIDGFIDTIEGADFDPGDSEEFPGNDVLRLAAEMVLIGAGYSREDVVNFLDTAPRGPMQLS